MRDILHHLNRHLDKIKKKANHHIDKISHHSKFETSNYKKSDKNSYWDNNTKPKRKKGTGEIILSLFFWLLLGLIVIIGAMLANANIVFLFRKAICSEAGRRCKITDETPAKAKKFLDSMFPTDCCEPPYGRKNDCPCPVKQDKYTMSEIKALNETPKFDALESTEVGVSSAKEKTAIKKNEAQKGGGACGIGFPYDKFAYGAKAEGFGRNYINWFLSSLANTEVKLNTYIKDGLKSKVNTVDERVMMLVSAMIFPLVLLWTYIYTLGSLVYDQVNGLLFGKTEFLTKIAIVLTGIIVFGADAIISTLNVIYILYKFLISPLLHNRSEVKAVIYDHQTMLGSFFALIFTIAVVVGLPSDREWGKVAKITVIILFCITTLIPLSSQAWALLVAIFESIIKLFSGGRTDSSEVCKL